jgi:hypothetical protein
VVGDIVSDSLDAVAEYLPFLSKIRGSIRKVTGFDERRATNSSTGGGPVVRTMNAPVAFARNQTSTFKRKLGVTDDGEIWHWKDNIGVLTASSSVNTFAATAYVLEPLNATMFPNFSVDAQEWERWRPYRAIIHFCHFQSTAAVSSVQLAYVDDGYAAEVSGADSSTKVMSGLTHYTMGSAYEDFSLEFTPASWKDGLWLYNDTTASTDVRLNYPGQVVIATDVNAVGSQGLGYIFMELFFEVCSRRAPYSGAGLAYTIRSAIRCAKEDEKRRVLEFGLTKLREVFMLEMSPKKDNHQPGNPLLSEFHQVEDEHLNIRLASAGITTSALNPGITQRR